jgi:hypothetical protein
VAYIEGQARDISYAGFEFDPAGWVRVNREVITAAAEKYGLPPDLLAGIAWKEAPGKGQIWDDMASGIRRLAEEPWSPVIPENLPGPLKGDQDATSYGAMAVQTRRAAEVLGYDPEHLTDGQREQIVASLKDPNQNIFIAAAYLKSLKDDSSAAYTAFDELTPEQYQELAARYNGGPYWRSEAAQVYGRDYMSKLDDARAALGSP